jgi:glyoxylase-like metal-dependent hydrolase (beta-lactamase superfamily II)
VSSAHVLRVGEVTVERTQHGPFERIVLIVPAGAGPAQLSVYRAGDTLIDAGSPRVAAALVEVLSDTPPRQVICTHQHEDHVGGIGALRERYGHIPVYAPAEHVELLKQLKPVPRFRHEHWGSADPVMDAIAYRPGERFELPEATLLSVATPGHTPGHIAFVAELPEAIFAMTGDLYIAPSEAAWWESAADDLMASCRKLAAYGEGLVMMPTHGRVHTGGAMRLLRLAELVEGQARRVREVAAEMDVPHWRIAEVCFGSEDPLARLSEGQFSKACLVRSVLEPVRSLPPTPVPLGPQ